MRPLMIAAMVAFVRESAHPRPRKPRGLVPELWRQDSRAPQRKLARRPCVAWRPGALARLCVCALSSTQALRDASSLLAGGYEV